jgi:hypothetical protein
MCLFWSATEYLRPAQLTRLVIPATEHVFYHDFPRKSILATHDAQRGQSPVDSIEPEMLGEVIGEIFTLLTGQLDDAHGAIILLMMWRACKNTHIVEILDVLYVEGDIERGCGR